MQAMIACDADISEQTREQSRFVAALYRRLIDPGLPVNSTEQSGRVVRGLRRAEQKVSTRIERVVEGAANLLLQFAVEVDQQIAARHKIYARERRVLQHTVACEEHGVANLLPDAILVAFTEKETPQPLLADVSLDRGRKASVARKCERPGIEIGTEYLNRRTDIVTRRLLEQQDRDRIGFLSGSAARDPDANGLIL